MAFDTALGYDDSIDGNPTLSENVKQLLRVGHPFADLEANGWIQWSGSLGQWLIVSRMSDPANNEAAMNALLTAYDVDQRIRYEDESLIGQVPKVAEDVGDAVGGAVDSLIGQTKAFAMIFGMVLLVWYMGRK